MDEPTRCREQKRQKMLPSRRATKPSRPAEVQDRNEQHATRKTDALAAPELKFGMRSGEPLFIIRLRG
jgi:hypothetical protein